MACRGIAEESASNCGSKKAHQPYYVTRFAGSFHFSTDLVWLTFESVRSVEVCELSKKSVEHRRNIIQLIIYRLLMAFRLLHGAEALSSARLFKSIKLIVPREWISCECGPPPHCFGLCSSAAAANMVVARFVCIVHVTGILPEFYRNAIKCGNEVIKFRISVCVCRICLIQRQRRK